MLLSYVRESVSGVLFSVGVCVCERERELLIFFLHQVELFLVREPVAAPAALELCATLRAPEGCGPVLALATHRLPPVHETGRWDGCVCIYIYIDI